jgi:diadenosine tetraphosphate (Ap4A) HIT family hydrolase
VFAEISNFYMKNGTNQKLCPFCESTDRDLLVDNANSFAILDNYPISPGHTLIIPIRHVGSYFDLTRNERDDLWDLVEQAKAALDSQFAPDSYNIGMNDGPAAGQTIGHCHIHVVPRYAGDVSDPRGGLRWIMPDKADYWSGR